MGSPLGMPLIVDRFDVPALLISQKLFSCTEVVELGCASRETIEMVLSYDRVYCIHEECADNGLEMLKYYFNEIVDVPGDVRYINKNRKTVKYYFVEKVNGFSKDIMEIMKKAGSKNFVDKTKFLPHLRAQEGETVIFPEDEE